MTPPSWPVSSVPGSVRKAVRRTELSLSLSSVYFGCWFKIIFCSLHGSYFVVELKVQSTLFYFSVNSKLGTRLNYFCTGFSVAQIASLQATGVVLSPYSQLVQFLHSLDRHASSCLVAVQAFNLLFSLAKRYSTSLTLEGVCYCIQNYFCHWSSHFELFSIYFSRWSLRCELFCHSTVIQHYFCCWSPRSELLFGWVIFLADPGVTLRIVLFAPLRFKIKLLWVKIALLRYSIQIGLCR